MERIAKINSKIEGYLRTHANDNRFFIPDSAFVVFESDKARRIMMKPRNSMMIGKEKVLFAKAPQPTDIIWENRIKEPRFQKLIFGSIALFILFSLNLLATFSFNDAQLDLIKKYDTKIDCQNLIKVSGIEK